MGAIFNEVKQISFTLILAFLLLSVLSTLFERVISIIANARQQKYFIFLASLLSAIKIAYTVVKHGEQSKQWPAAQLLPRPDICSENI